MYIVYINVYIYIYSLFNVLEVPNGKLGVFFGCP